MLIQMLISTDPSRFAHLLIIRHLQGLDHRLQHLLCLIISKVIIISDHKAYLDQLRYIILKRITLLEEIVDLEGDIILSLEELNDILDDLLQLDIDTIKIILGKDQ